MDQKQQSGLRTAALPAPGSDLTLEEAERLPGRSTVLLRSEDGSARPAYKRFGDWHVPFTRHPHSLEWWVRREVGLTITLVHVGTGDGDPRRV